MSVTMVPTKLVSLKAAVIQATGRRPHFSTISRWATVGISGIRLQTWIVGGRRLTTPEAVAEFVQATTAAANGESRESPLGSEN